MEYKAVCTVYPISRLVGEQPEIGDWSEQLNSLSQKGWRVKNSGAIPDGERIIFWAVLAKPGKLDLTND